MARDLRQRFLGRLLLPLCFGAALFGTSAWAEQPELNAPVEAEGAAAPVRAFKSVKPVRPTPSEELGIDLSRVPQLRLGALDVDRILQQDELDRRQGRVKVLHYGIGRDVQLSAGDGHWYDLAGGARLWVAEVAATDALGLRLHFSDVRLPAGAEIAVYAPSEGDADRGIVKNGWSRFDPERSVEFFEGRAGAEARELWTGTIPGERARIEYFVPAGVAASKELPFRVDNLQHLYLDPVAQTAKNLVGAKMAGNCHNDVTCHSGWAEIARAVSGIGIVSGGRTGFCTGQLLNINAKKPDFTPYFLTANHCLETGGEAQSTEFYWFYQTAACGGTPPSLNSVPRSSGASLLSTSPLSDFTLLMVEGALPEGLFWSGWTSAQIANGTPATAIHHPSGDFKRISFGEKAEQSICGSNSLLRINWNDAPTEPGSSGSGIFRDSDQKLFGQLFFGESRCGLETWDCYGAFATTFPRIRNFLRGGSDDNLEQNDACNRARQAKQGTTGGRIVKITDPDWFKISVPPGKTVNISLDFDNSQGDIDLKMFSSCKGGELSSSLGTTNKETLSVKNTGRKASFLFWNVFLANDTRNSYSMTVTFE
ncbi:MAG TPA: trypsin-like peptidase domain-containing protein [Thermoanaerobaculia bacterium]|nr:trypsin-like peptidase domain-containing protein [Thermoanaerobaculia bacterium]